jgi:hypothetical protein
VVGPRKTSIGGVDLLGSFFRLGAKLGIVLEAVGVPHSDEVPIRLSDLVRGGARLDTESLVVGVRGQHESPRGRSAAPGNPLTVGPTVLMRNPRCLRDRRLDGTTRLHTAWVEWLSANWTNRTVVRGRRNRLGWMGDARRGDVLGCLKRSAAFLR